MLAAPGRRVTGVRHSKGSRRLRLAFLGDPSSIHLRRWLTFFASRGHEVYLLLEDRQADPSDLTGGVAVRRFTSYGARLGPFGVSRARRSLRRVLAEVEPTIVHAHYLVRFGWLGALAGHHPFVLTVWGSDVLLASTSSLPERAADWWALRSADLVTGVSENLLRAAAAAGASPGRCRVVQFGANRDVFSPGPAPEWLRERLGLRGRRIVFGPRVLAPLYRHDVELAALERLPDDVVLVWAALHPAPGSLDALMSEATARGVANRVIVVPEITHEEMPDFYRLADVVVSIPERDAFSVTLVEAMASGCPVVVTRLPAVQEGWAGLPPEWLVPVGDEAATADALLRALSLTPEERARLGAQLRQAALSRADEESSLLEMEHIYRDLADGQGGSREVNAVVHGS